MTLATPALEAIWPSLIAKSPTIASYQAGWRRLTIRARWFAAIGRGISRSSDPGSGGDVIHRVRRWRGQECRYAVARST